MAPTVQVCENLAEAARAVFLKLARAAIASKRCHIALSGGSTPKILYQGLTAEDLDWERVELFFGDERRVPLDDERSNFKMVKEALLSRVEIQAHPLVDAANYQGLLEQKLGPEPAFDLMLLGMGDDGHTASLFPGSAALAETTRWVVEAPGVAPSPERLTITPPVIKAAKRILVLVGGASKAARLAEVLEGPRGRYPAQIILEAQGEVTWLIDKPAAILLRAH